MLPIKAAFLIFQHNLKLIWAKPIFGIEKSKPKYAQTNL
jgi:hypothetical protein